MGLRVALPARRACGLLSVSAQLSHTGVRAGLVGTRLTGRAGRSCGADGCESQTSTRPHPVQRYTASLSSHCGSARDSGELHSVQRSTIVLMFLSPTNRLHKTRPRRALPRVVRLCLPREVGLRDLGVVLQSLWGGCGAFIRLTMATEYSKIKALFGLTCQGG